MESSKPVLQITPEEWRAKERRGMAAVIAQRQYIVTTHESTNEPVYQPVVIITATTRR